MHGYTHPGVTNGLRRAVVVLLLALAMLATTAFAPVNAGEGGGDDLESVRATVVETYNYKINKLGESKAGTSNEDRKAVYQSGINQLTELRNHNVTEADTVDALWALKDMAHGIYNETKAAAEEVGETPEEKLQTAKDAAHNKVEHKINALRSWVEGCEDPEVNGIVAQGIEQLMGLFPLIEAAQTPDAAYALKSEAHSIYNSTMDRAQNAKGDEKEEPKEEPKEKTEEEKAAEELAKTRRNTLALIANKASILRKAAEAAQLEGVVEIFTAAATEVSVLTDAAKAAKTVGALKGINGLVMEIYEDATAGATEIREQYEASPEQALNRYLNHVVDYVKHTTARAAETADESPDTYDTLYEAKGTVLEAVESVRAVTESGSGLDDRWEDLHDALRNYRRALIRHYIALGRPALIGDLQIPG